MLNLSGKNICFVGGLGGIGLETCKQLMTKNIACLAIFDSIENPTAIKTLQALNSACRVLYMKIDVTNKTSIKQCMADVVKQMKHIDILINGAGVLADRNVELTINVNLIGLINTTLVALPYMDKNKGGNGGMIVNIASVLGLEPCPPIAVYTASKFGVIGFTRSLADPFYYNKTGVAVMAVCPGITNTSLVSTLEGKDTMDCSKELSEAFMRVEKQDAANCAMNIVQAVEQGKNGALWICDRGTLKLAEPKLYWEM